MHEVSGSTSSDEWSAEEQLNVAVVRKLLDALVARDWRIVKEVMTPDAVFAMGEIGRMPPPTRADLPGLLAGITSVEIEIRKTFVAGPIVVMDRFDRLVWPERAISGRWIGLFALKDGKVVEFIDYTIDRTVT
jgi:limonene-1,2-epoxide hydrolase